MKLFGKAPGTLDPVREGDRLRDAGQWSQAAEFYAKHLEDNPLDVAILVQCGNCLKEATEYKQAEKRYRAALDIDPNNTDTHLQYGHLMKQMGRPLDAIESYKRSVERDPSNQDAVMELIAAGAAAEVFGMADVDAGTRTIWLDVTDLMEYARVNKSLSGIQRVVSNLILHVASGAVGDYRAIPVIPEYDRHRILAASPAALAALVRQFDAPIVDRTMIDRAIAAVYETRSEVWPNPGDIFLVAGAFWIYPHYDVIRTYRKKGMRFGVFIHDLIQIRNPEYVQQAAVDKFQKQLIDVLSVCDFVLTNSAFVASEVKKYLQEYLNFTLPVQPILLATELRKTSKSKRIVNENIRVMANEEYVLCVATIEVRKNHMYQVRIWERLIKEFGAKIPKLVWVGKWGWQIDELRHHLAEQGCVGDWLFIFNDISDDELEYLYHHCLFTIYTSFAEGFGLPIGESLAYKKPCIASNTTSMPEVGGRFVRYIEPWNQSEGYAVVRDTILDPKGLAEWAADIEANFSPKTWREFCDEFYSTAIGLSKAVPKGPGSINCLLPKNTIVEGGDDALFRMAAEHKPIITFRAARDSGWFYMENWGVWASERRSSLAFDTELKQGDKARIYLEVKCPPKSHEISLVVSSGAALESFKIYHWNRFISFEGIVGENGRVGINLVARGRFGDTDHRSLHIGLTSVAYCDGSDPLARIDLLEKVTLYSQIEHMQEVI
jgi:glycosyltransferase involved in cell wall biosynthesis